MDQAALENIIANEAALADCLANSFRNFHARGLDYICLKRTPGHTQKLYMLDGDVAKLPKVVCPHDHRYDFKSTVLAGKMANQSYEIGTGTVFNAFDFYTPLKGGDGFVWREETELALVRESEYERGEYYLSAGAAVHTISMRADQTVVLLDQYADRLPSNQPTTTFVPDRQPPSLDGLYDRFTADQLISRVRLIGSLLQ
ncbi:MAG: hypothetical protein JJ864_08690 [Rhizobiaceae bacterium]|nr:hypothetical protein [Rhizobiaceae bacterium]